jgi:hypothetical protein
MKQLAVVTLLIFGGLAAWLFASRLSADAPGMAVGLVFGVLAGVPTALLVLAAGRRRRSGEDEEDGDEMNGRYGQQYPAQALPYQPPVIVVASPQAAPQWAGPQTVDSVSYPVRPALPGPGASTAQGGRVFKVVGEKEEWLDEW